eukprot:TRINITY_DN5728_c0_g1_i1.p1 TRINITY_DN5728_c0_g1~~TRINITY_DN5728_c0_g1_i1.p1  ORF type:complete len:593 (+),score=131.10 TRINITY_DN5728_c0_g1_i1:93-1781(+)
MAHASRQESGTVGTEPAARQGGPITEPVEGQQEMGTIDEDQDPTAKPLTRTEKCVVVGACFALFITTAMVVGLIYITTGEELIVLPDGTVEAPVLNDTIHLTARAPDGPLLGYLFAGCMLLMFCFNVLFMDRFLPCVNSILEDTMKRRYEQNIGYLFACNKRVVPIRDDDIKESTELKCSAKLRDAWDSLMRLPLWANILLGFIALNVVGWGALGFMLMVGMANMPRHRDNPAWIEVSWQVINGIFTLLALYRQPMRLRFLFTLTGKSYLDPTRRGIGTGPDSHGRYAPLLWMEVKDAWIMCIMRNCNCIFQYCVCIFMWGWLPACWEEELELFQDCTSRPAWGTPLFLVLSMGSDIAAGVFKGKCIKRMKMDFESSCTKPLQTDPVPVDPELAVQRAESSARTDTQEDVQRIVTPPCTAVNASFQNIRGDLRQQLQDIPMADYYPAGHLTNPAMQQNMSFVGAGGAASFVQGPKSFAHPAGWQGLSFLQTSPGSPQQSFAGSQYMRGGSPTLRRSGTGTPVPPAALPKSGLTPVSAPAQAASAAASTPPPAGLEATMSTLK